MFWLSDVFTDTDSARFMRQYEARARAARRQATRSTFAAAGHVLGRLGTVVTRGIASRVRAAHQRRVLTHALDNLDDRLLADIGLTRDDVAVINHGDWPARSTDESEKPAARLAMSANEDAFAETGAERPAHRWRRAA